jgi:hypothetical protein
MSRSKFMLAGIALVAGLVILLVTRKGVYDTQPILEIADIFEEKTRGIRQGRSNYPLPDREDGEIELSYLSEMTDLFMKATEANCFATERSIQAQARLHREQTRTSLFRWAANLQKRRSGADFVHRTSDQIGPGFSFSLNRRTVPIDTDDRLEQLKETTAHIKQVERAPVVLRGFAEAAGRFADVCPDEKAVIDEALGYVLGK